MPFTEIQLLKSKKLLKQGYKHSSESGMPNWGCYTYIFYYSLTLSHSATWNMNVVTHQKAPEWNHRVFTTQASGAARYSATPLM